MVTNSKIFKSNNCIALMKEFKVSFSIVFLGVWSVVDTPIELNNQSNSSTVKIDYVRTESALPPKFFST